MWRKGSRPPSAAKAKAKAAKAKAPPSGDAKAAKVKAPPSGDVAEADARPIESVVLSCSLKPKPRAELTGNVQDGCKMRRLHICTLYEVRDGADYIAIAQVMKEAILAEGLSKSQALELRDAMTRP